MSKTNSRNYRFLFWYFVEVAAQTFPRTDRRYSHAGTCSQHIENVLFFDDGYIHRSESSDWKFRRVIEKFKVGIEEINYDAVETSSKNLKVGRKSSTWSTSDSESFSKRIWKSVKIWGSYGQQFSVLFFDSRCRSVAIGRVYALLRSGIGVWRRLT